MIEALASGQWGVSPIHGMPLLLLRGFAQMLVAFARMLGQDMILHWSVLKDAGCKHNDQNVS